MSAFQSLRIAHEFTQTNIASPERVFPLLCPVRQADWVPGWDYRLIYSTSGVAEEGCIFTTPNAAPPNPPPDGALSREHAQSSSQSATPFPDTIWITTAYDPAAFRIAFVWINPGLVATEIRIQLTPAPNQQTHAYIRYRYTGLSPDGNREVTRFDRAWFEDKMRGWETAINHYLRTGRRIDAPAWE